MAFDEFLIQPARTTRNSRGLNPSHFASNYGGGPIDAADVARALAYITIPYASPVIGWDLSQGINFAFAITASVTLNFPANTLLAVGKTGYLEVLSSGGAFALSFQASVGFTFDSGTAPANDNTSGHYTQYVWHCRSPTEVRIGLALKGVR